MNKVFEDLKDGKYDILVSGFSVTPERQQLVSFTRPIMLNHASIAYYEDTILTRLTDNIVNIITLFLAVIMVFVVIFTVGFLFSYIEHGGKKYKKHYSSSVFTVITSLLGEGPDSMPMTITGKIMILTLMILGVTSIGLITAAFTTYFITHLGEKFNDPTDIRHSVFYVLKGSAAENEVKRYGGVVKAVDKEAIKEYVNNREKANGVVNDFPILFYNVETKYPNLKISDFRFSDDELAIAVRKDRQDILQKINLTIVNMRESGLSTRICQMYLGEKGSLCEL